VDNLLSLLKSIGSLERAPQTVRAGYPAPRSPYKPIMLLTTLRRLQQGRAPFIDNRITFPECLSDFSSLYSKVYGDSSDMETKATQAFWYLGAGKPRIWQHVPTPGMENQLLTCISERAQIKTMPKLTSMVEYARFPEEVWALVTDCDVQKALIAFLISEQFTDVRKEVDLL
jgi:predicted restriction endonuclease